MDESFQSFDGRPPEDTAFQDAAPISLKVLQRDFAPLFFGHVRKTESEIGQGDVATFFHQIVADGSQSFSETA